MSYDLIWLLTRKSSSYIVDAVPEGPIFSREPGNLLNIHSHKYSIIADPKPLSIVDGPSGVEVVTRKPSASIHSVKSARHVTRIRGRSGPRRAAGIAIQKPKSGYRSDLKKPAAARISAILASKKEKKPLPEKKPRGKKAKAAASE
ncbi:uncharacterized protein FOMMEDRAFT_82981 [Fomitiporia mediterranea MF3/22]|uniref:uncharacterized protein n=1 Tax=Fomitiporia mediterranea (strain MF3/22) TaxID=694068 RepID=UPI0004409BC6|nr:uncharacterized protein FOMMEDRAFT_82981 [Fomitiporia mediterranea MF3/22]EJD03532.1 hypothetical protein FOMMEDRAFT_82981 [Fomitiporia mediterranea MF3/22]